MKIRLPAAAININIIVIIIGAIVLSCQGRNKKPYKNIYTLTLDFTNTNFSALIPAARFSSYVEQMNLKNSGLSDIYTIGVKSYCKGRKLQNGDYRITYCTGISENYYFDPNTLIAQQISRANQRINLSTLEATDIKLPSGVPWFRTKKGSIVDKVFITLLLGVLFSGISFLLNMVSMCFPDGQEIILGFSFLTSLISSIMLLIGAAIATNVYDRTRKGFINGYEQFGIKASWGNSAFYILVWLLFGLQMLFVISVLSTAWVEKWMIKRREKRSDVEVTETHFDGTRNRFRSRFDRDSDAEDVDVPRYPIEFESLPTYQEATRPAVDAQKEEDRNRLQRDTVE